MDEISKALREIIGANVFDVATAGTDQARDFTLDAMACSAMVTAPDVIRFVSVSGVPMVRVRVWGFGAYQWSAEWSGPAAAWERELARVSAAVNKNPDEPVKE